MARRVRSESENQAGVVIGLELDRARGNLWTRGQSATVVEHDPERALFLTVGPAGPSTGDRFGYLDADVIDTPTLAEAIDLARERRPAVVLCASRFEDGSLLEPGSLDRLRAAFLGESVPLIAVLEPTEWHLVEACLLAGATDVVERGDEHALAVALSNAIGWPRGSGGQRVPFEARVEVEVDGRRYGCSGIYLGPTGLAITGLPLLGTGTRARLLLAIGGDVVSVWGRVSRSTWQGPKSARVTVVSFLAVNGELREALSQEMERRIDEEIRKFDELARNA